MKEAHIMFGLPGAGKSRHVNKLLEQHGMQVICRDDIRYSLGINGHDSKSYNPSVEPVVSLIADKMLLAHMHRGLSIILDETHTHPNNMEKCIDRFCRAGYKVTVWHIVTDRTVCQNRRPCIPDAVYNRMEAQMHDTQNILVSYVAAGCIEIRVVKGE